MGISALHRIIPQSSMQSATYAAILVSSAFILSLVVRQPLLRVISVLCPIESYFSPVFITFYLVRKLLLCNLCCHFQQMFQILQPLHSKPVYRNLHVDRCPLVAHKSIFYLLTQCSSEPAYHQNCFRLQSEYGIYFHRNLAFCSLFWLQYPYNVFAYLSLYPHFKILYFFLKKFLKFSSYFSDSL